MESWSGITNPRPFCIGFVDDEKLNLDPNTETTDMALLVQADYPGNCRGSRIIVNQSPRTECCLRDARDSPGVC